MVNCRIGSLENQIELEDAGIYVNCRIGSLEISEFLKSLLCVVNCRIGSLESVLCKSSPGF